MTLFTHMRPRAKDLSSMSCRGSPSGMKGKGTLPIQLSLANAYLGMCTFWGSAALKAVPQSRHTGTGAHRPSGPGVKSGSRRVWRSQRHSEQ